MLRFTHLRFSNRQLCCNHPISAFKMTTYGPGCLISPGRWLVSEGSLKAKGWLKLLFLAICMTLPLVQSVCQTTALLQHFPQFHHTLWSADSGIGAVYDIQQAGDGFLWLQTSTGVFRFDGVRFQTVAELLNDPAQSRKIEAALPSHSRGVWFTTQASGLLLWRDGRLQALPDEHCTGIIAEAQDGSLWVASKVGLFHVHGSSCDKVGAEMAYPGGEPAGIMMDHEGTLWVKTWTGDLLSLPPGGPKFLLSPYGQGATRFAAFLHEAPDRSVWLSDDYGMRQVRGAWGGPFVPRAAGAPHKKSERFQDFDVDDKGAVWLITDKGLRLTEHIEQWQTPQQMEQEPGENFTVGQNLSSDTIWADLIDHEGNVWLGTDAGLEQLRRVALYTPKLAYSQEHELAVAPGEKSSIWTGSLSLPLTHLEANGTSKTFPAIGQITCLRRDRNGVIWVASEGSSHLQKSLGEGFEPVHYPHENAQAVVSLAVDRNNELWIALRQLGIFHLSHGKWINEDAAIGKEPTTLGAMTDDQSGNVWIAYENRLVRWDGSRYANFALPGGSLGISASTIMVSHDHVWLAGDDGVGLYARGQFHLLHGQDGKLLSRVTGILEAADGDLWMNGPSGVNHVASAEISKWVSDPALLVAANHFDQLDGLPGFSGEIVPTPSLIQSPDGWIWFATTKGIAGLDPSKLAGYRNNVPPPVVITSILSDGKSYQNFGDIRLPAHTRSLQIDYTALSFSIPERVNFRYKLDGVDEVWEDAGTRRQAYYNGLAPGRHRFHVIASNNDGVWNEAGATLLFTVAPAFYQTWWFRLLLATAAALLAWFLIRLRIRILLRELQGRLTVRVEERERIARELHDTLLQGLFGLILRLQFSMDQLPDGHPVRADMVKALGQSELIMKEGRERIRDLRASPSQLPSLGDALEHFGHELQSILPVQFEVSVEGLPRAIDPYVYEEILLIGREALTNAFRHAEASAIGVDLAYRLSGLQLRVHDNGRGVNRSVLESGGKKDHWGLPNMRERAKKMHATFHMELLSKGGTQVELRVPAAIAYRSHKTIKHRLRVIFSRGISSHDRQAPTPLHQETRD